MKIFEEFILRVIMHEFVFAPHNTLARVCLRGTYLTNIRANRFRYLYPNNTTSALKPAMFM
jgi:hypothetical protein